MGQTQGKSGTLSKKEQKRLKILAKQRKKASNQGKKRVKYDFKTEEDFAAGFGNISDTTDVHNNNVLLTLENSEENIQAFHAKEDNSSKQVVIVDSLTQEDIENKRTGDYQQEVVKENEKPDTGKYDGSDSDDNEYSDEEEPISGEEFAPPPSPFKDRQRIFVPEQSTPRDISDDVAHVGDARFQIEVHSSPNMYTPRHETGTGNKSYLETVEEDESESEYYSDTEKDTISEKDNGEALEKNTIEKFDDILREDQKYVEMEQQSVMARARNEKQTAEDALSTPRRLPDIPKVAEAKFKNAKDARASLKRNEFRRSLPSTEILKADYLKQLPDMYKLEMKERLIGESVPDWYRKQQLQWSNEHEFEEDKHISKVEGKEADLKHGELESCKSDQRRHLSDLDTIEQENDRKLVYLHPMNKKGYKKKSTRRGLKPVPENSLPSENSAQESVKAKSSRMHEYSKPKSISESNRQNRFHVSSGRHVHSVREAKNKEVKIQELNQKRKRREMEILKAQKLFCYLSLQKSFTF
ncbi:hypothetical protein DPMN_088542 [Dreissena polymorpha]|uniref:Uncharacterized protein n=1 Tax=Dreissena polymorpha TaxID=45954 RepID=A0A9D4KV72_DREPO|nr:hypothetical protein DPMN_088542 [Dreissena polymorpha]